MVTLRANLKTLSGRDSTTVDQVAVSLPSNALTVCPWTTRPEVWLSLEAVLAACTRALAFVVVSALLAPGSSFIASTTVWNGLNGALVCRCSLSVSACSCNTPHLRTRRVYKGCSFRDLQLAVQDDNRG